MPASVKPKRNRKSRSVDRVGETPYLDVMREVRNTTERIVMIMLVVILTLVLVTMVLLLALGKAHLPLRALLPIITALTVLITLVGRNIFRR